jgi:hypothetical protein
MPEFQRFEGRDALTKLPFEQRNRVRPAKGPDYEIPNLCSHPYCDETEVERHHLVRRSELAGDYAWVQYGDLKIANICGLCRTHHQQITENKSMIRWSQPLALFLWVEGHGWMNGGWEGVLTPRIQAIKSPPDNVPGDEEVVIAQPMEIDHNVCPNCKRPFRKKTEQEKAKVRKTWAVSVPKTEHENGAEVLDTLLEESRKMMAQSGMVAYGDEAKARYYVLAAALGLFVQHGQEVLSNG